jgi:hypothetical protein
VCEFAACFYRGAWCSARPLSDLISAGLYVLKNVPAIPYVGAVLVQESCEYNESSATMV